MQKTETAPKLRNDEKINWDKNYSTFYWHIHLNPSHEKNHPGVQIITGYSKKVNQDEAKDKIQLLMRKIHTIAGMNGYIFRSRKIEFFVKREKIIDKSKDELIVTLFPKTFQITSNFIKAKYEPIHRFLDDFYDCIIKQQDVKNILPKAKASWSKDDYMNIKDLYFNTPGQLDLYCAKLVRNGHPFDAVLNFRMNYLDKKPFRQ